MKIGFIGRFQPFHIGHKHVVEQFSDEELVIVIGSAGESRTDENPLNSDEREEIIRECLPEIDIFHVEDFESDEEWREEVLAKTEVEAVVSGNERAQEIMKEEVEVVEPDYRNPEVYSGSEVRRRIKGGEEWSYLVPECAREKLREFEDRIRKSGTQYEFEPGWKKENAYRGTAGN
ncbi:MAG: adenylyltransferase/cytidyltransferase family protein [Candidatus Nanosalina sp.]